MHRHPEEAPARSGFADSLISTLRSRHRKSYRARGHPPCRSQRATGRFQGGHARWRSVARASRLRRKPRGRGRVRCVRGRLGLDRVAALVSGDAVTLRAQVTAIAQRGGLSVARTAGAHDRTGIQQCLDAGVDIVLVPYINTVEEAKESIRHCLFAPRGDRVWNGSGLSRSKKTAVMFQLETSACIDALKEICFMFPELEILASSGLETWPCSM